MDQDEMDRGFSNVDHRLERVEQILPTLATKDDLQAAIKPLATKAELRAAIDKAVEPLATKAELRAAIDKAVEPLATKAELRAAIDEAVEPLATKAQLRETNAELRTAITESEHRMRTYFDVIAESLRDDIQLIATAVATLSQRGL